jgi:hypothetical protein
MNYDRELNTYCRICAERRLYNLVLPYFCEPCWNLQSGACDLCGENDGHTNQWRHTACQQAYEDYHESLCQQAYEDYQESLEAAR